MEELLFKPYSPKSFCREFVEVKGSSLQLGMYMALVLGFKPLLDDWVPKERLSEFKKICRKYKIYVREDVIFVNIHKDDIPPYVLGKKYLTTTSAYGYPVESDIEGQVHLFLSKDKNLLKKGMWYPVIIKDRAISPPRADHLNYGYVLGYPDCCIRFFKKYNNWLKYSYLYEAYRNTRGLPLFFCNPFFKDTTFSYIYHMPCSYDCKKTSILVNKLREEIKIREPDYVKITDQYLKMPFLVFYERKFYCFEGQLKGNLLEFRKVYFPSPDESKDIYGEEFRKADSLKLQGREIFLYRKGKILKTISVPLNEFAPEFPFLIQFK
ncbi:MAG: hypothetical protein ISS47_05140 [Candidatus Omnitrophica bacterium]|nr:hypothetical protein [Candidatus Omnitrophota bacterium]